MPTAALSGKKGRVYVSLSGKRTSYERLGETKEFNLTIEQEDLQQTSYGNTGWEQYNTGMRSWGFTTSSLYVKDTNAIQTDVYNSLVAGQIIYWRLLPSFGSGKTGYQGSGFVTSFEVDVEVSDAVMLSLNIKGTDELKPYTVSLT